MAWKSPETRPRGENSSFLVHTYGNSVCAFLVLQVTIFEGRMFPDHLEYNIDENDEVEGIFGWMEIPPEPDGCRWTELDLENADKAAEQLKIFFEE